MSNEMRIHPRGVLVLVVVVVLLMVGVNSKWVLAGALAAAAIDFFTFSGLLGLWAPRAVIRRKGRLH